MAGSKENIQRVSSVFREVGQLVSPYLSAQKALRELLPKGPVQLDKHTQECIRKYKDEISNFENSNRVLDVMDLLDDLHEVQLLADEGEKPGDELACEVVLHKAEILYKLGLIEGAEDALCAEMDRVQISTGDLAHPSVYLMLASIYAQNHDNVGDAIEFLQNMKEYPALWNYQAQDRMSAPKMLRILTASNPGKAVTPQPK